MLSSIKKTVAYAQKNGIVAAYYAAKERLEDNKKAYDYEEIPKETIIKQTEEMKDIQGLKKAPFFSILVPCYNTPSRFFIEMVESVIAQTYPKWELILADSSEDDKLREIVNEHYKDDLRIRYIHLDSNKGISDNTNEAVRAAKGDYCCLLDHDDLITKDALYSFAKEIMEEMDQTGVVRPSGCGLILIYSDEDKTNENMTKFYEPNIKPSYNLDYLLSNNYICHFTAVRTDVLKANLFRKNYDGAQDYDLILRTCIPLSFRNEEKNIRHIAKVLYHWRCHEDSTAANPKSKEYAYEAGRAAVENVMQSSGFNVRVNNLKHVGFYRVEYPDGIFRTRKDIGIVGGKITDKSGTLIGGIYKEDASKIYYGLPKGYSGGFNHIAACQQDALAVDLRCMRIRKKLRPLLKEVTGLSYLSNKDILKQKDRNIDPEDETDLKIHGKHIIIPDSWDEDKIINESIRFCKAVRHLGYRIIWDPQMK